MKILQVCRRIDGLGRVVIPAYIIKALDVEYKSAVNIILRGDEFIVKKHIPNVSRFNDCIGSVRNLDNLNRIVLPKELRNELEIHSGQLISVSLAGDSIIIKKEPKMSQCN